MKVLLLAGVCLLAVAAAGETSDSESSSLPVAPTAIIQSAVKLKPPANKINGLDITLWVGVGAYRWGDYLTTRRGIALGAREVVLPESIAKSGPKLAAVEVIAFGAEVGGSALLIHYGHRKWARAMDIFSISVGTAFLVNNVHAIQTQESNNSTLVRE